MGEFKRLFIGISLPQSYERIVIRLQQALRPLVRSKVGWTVATQVHATLCFLGQVEAARLGELIQELAGIRSTPYQLGAGGGGFFPRKPPPRVIWAGFTTGFGETRSLAGKIGSRMVRSGFIETAPPLVPHLTLGRVRKPARDSWEPILQILEAQKWPMFTVDGFTLWESVPDPKRPVHLVLETFPLSEG